MDRKIEVMGWLEGLAQDDWMKWHSDSEVQGIAKAALELLKEQKPMTPETDYMRIQRCPKCKTRLRGKYCYGCGQAVKWE